MGCRNESADVKVLLNNMFPAGICDMICDYNLHCFKYSMLNFKEKDYIKITYDRYTTVEKQIDFFQTEMPTPIYVSDSNRTNVRAMRREIDVLMGTMALKERFKHNKLYLQAIKPYVKKNWKYTYHILYYFHDLDFITSAMKTIRAWWFPDLEGYIYCRNRPFKIEDILEIFLREYLKELYINEAEIEEHLQQIINT